MGEYDWKTAILGNPKHRKTPAVPGTVKNSRKIVLSVDSWQENYPDKTQENN